MMNKRVDSLNPILGHDGNDNKGSILIWTVTIGLALTTAFFFLAVRLGVIRDAQRDTIAYHSQKAYLESYVAYLKLHPPMASPFTIPDFDGMKATVTRQATIDGVLDSGNSATVNLSGFGVIQNVVIHWNLCGEETGDLKIVNEIKLHGGASCPSGEYADSFVLAPTPMSINLQTMNAPLHYRITQNGTGTFNNAKWAIHAEIPVGNFGKKIEMNDLF